VRCLRENDILIWGTDIREKEGYQGELPPRRGPCDGTLTTLSSTSSLANIASDHVSGNLVFLPHARKLVLWIILQLEIHHPHDRSRTTFNHHLGSCAYSVDHEYDRTPHSAIPEQASAGTTRARRSPSSEGRTGSQVGRVGT
jgi:hypothetical protein